MRRILMRLSAPVSALAELGIDAEPFVEFLKLSFGQKRKTLLNNLKINYDPALIRAALKSQRLREDVRAEAIPLEKAAGVFLKLNQNSE